MTTEYRFRGDLNDPGWPIRVRVDGPGFVNVYAWQHGDGVEAQCFANPDNHENNWPADCQLQICEFVPE